MSDTSPDATHATPAEVSAAAHRGLPHANPLSVAAMDSLVSRAAARAPGNALDVGCGNGACAIELARRVPVDVVAVDTNAWSLARARADAAAATLRGTVTFEERDAATLPVPTPAFDLAICLGSSHAFGTPREAVGALAERIRPGGAVILGELVWAREPAAPLLEALGCERSFHWSTDEADAVFADAGLVVAHRVRASLDDWDHYERAVRDGRLAFARTRGALPSGLADAAAIAARANGWFELYETHARGTLGFDAWCLVRSDDPS